MPDNHDDKILGKAFADYFAVNSLCSIELVAKSKKACRT